jgi:hypothetical protein
MSLWVSLLFPRLIGGPTAPLRLPRMRQAIGAGIPAIGVWGVQRLRAPRAPAAPAVVLPLASGRYRDSI